MEIRNLRNTKLTDYIDENIEVCPRCKGEGITKHQELEDYHHRTYKVSYEVCESCKGSGRVIIQTIRIKGCIPYIQRKLK
jgi:DnaJ-class molecular chaperone